MAIPRKNNALLAWSANLIAQIEPNPTDWGVTSALVTSYQGLQSAYQSALAAADPSVRNKQATADMHNAKDALTVAARNIASLIYGTPSVTDGMKLAAGLTVRAHPTPWPVPPTYPSLDIVSVSARTVRVRLHDNSGEGKRNKPFMVKGATVMSYVGETAPIDPAQWALQGTTTKSIFDVTFASSLAPGTTVWLSAMWVNEKLQAGNACPPVSVSFGSAAVA